jgi:hypothetical protein
MSNDLTTVEKPGRGEYSKRVSVRVERALQSLASGTTRTISAAAEASGLTRRALGLALAKPHVRQRMEEVIRESLKAGSLRASSRMRELMENEANPMAAFRASQYLLATGAGIVQPSPPTAQINVIGAGPVGYVIDLSGPGQSTRMVIDHRAQPSAADPRAIEHQLPVDPGGEPE